MAGPDGVALHKEDTESTGEVIHNFTVNLGSFGRWDSPITIWFTVRATCHPHWWKGIGVMGSMGLFCKSVLVNVKGFRKPAGSDPRGRNNPDGVKILAPRLKPVVSGAGLVKPAFFHTKCQPPPSADLVRYSLP